MKPTAELTDMLTGGSSSTEVADKIKDLLYAKASEKIDAFRPQVADNLFGNLSKRKKVKQVLRWKLKLAMKNPKLK